MCINRLISRVYNYIGKNHLADKKKSLEKIASIWDENKGTTAEGAKTRLENKLFKELNINIINFNCSTSIFSKIMTILTIVILALTILAIIVAIIVAIIQTT